MNTPTNPANAEASLLAGAVGDALGSCYEGQVAPELTLDGPWAITDDTQMTLATCEAIIEADGVDPERIAASFARWHRERRITGIGSSTLKALTELAAGGHWALVGAQGGRAAGNGAAMRIAPLAFCLDPQDLSDRRIIRDVCQITHRNDEAYAGALAVLVAMSAPPGPCAAILGDVADAIPDSVTRDRLRLMADAGDQSIAAVAAEHGAGGYVAESVPLALLAACQLEHCDGLTDLFARLIRCGGDTDTNCSIAGQIVGAWHGMRVVPEDCLAKLRVRVGSLDTFTEFGKMVAQ